MIAYPQVFLYTDSIGYLESSHGWQPDWLRQSGYSLVLKVLRRTHSPYSVSGLQHLLGLGTAVALYALLQHRRVPKWLSVIAVAPLLFDAFELTFEHYVLTETIFTTLIVAGLLALAWPGRPGTRAAALAGVLLAASVTVRVVSLPLVVLTIGYLIVRRAGWTPVAAFTCAAAAPLVGYVLWFHHFYGVYGFTTAQGYFLYGRVAPVADCHRLRLTPQPVGQRPIRSDWYIFQQASPGRNGTEETQQSFAIAVFTQQPGTMARVITLDTMRYLVPNRVRPDWTCLTGASLLPARPPPTADYSWCQPNPRQSFDLRAEAVHPPPTTRVTRALGTYASGVQSPHLLLGLSLALVLAAASWRPGRRTGVPVADLLLFAGWGLGLLVLSVAGSMFDQRYGLASTALLPVAGAQAWQRLRACRSGDEVAT